MKFIKDIHYSTNLERAILGACLIEKTAFGRIFTLLEETTFYHLGHRHVFKTLREMYLQGIPIDTFTVIDQLVRVQQKSIIQNPNHYITNLTVEVVSSTNLEYHSYAIKTMWMEREVIKLTQGGVKIEGDTRQKLMDLRGKIDEIQQKTISHDWADMTQLMVDLYKHQAEMKRTEGIGIHCGIPYLDKQNGGFHNGQMIVIGARPSVGKSTLAGCMAIDMAKNKKIVGIISLEMANNEIAARLAAIDTMTDFSVLYRGLYQDEYQTHEVYKRIGNHTSTLPIYVSDATTVSIIDIRSKAEKLKSMHGLDVLMIDYLQLIDSPETGNRTRENEIAKISRYCKVMAKELNIPVVLLCQLNREVTKRSGEHRFPQLSDIRESGSIEQDADVVMFLHRDWMNGLQSDENGVTTENDAHLIVRKWRNGASNLIIPMEFNGPQMTIRQKSALGSSWKPIN